MRESTAKTRERTAGGARCSGMPRSFYPPPRARECHFTPSSTARCTAGCARWLGDLLGLALLTQAEGLVNALSLVAFPVAVVWAWRQ